MSRNLIAVPVLVGAELVLVSLGRHLVDSHVKRSGVDVLVVGILRHDEVIVPCHAGDGAHDTVEGALNLQVAEVHLSLGGTLDIEAHVHLLTCILAEVHTELDELAICP